jgi:hypothetical protein
MLSEGRYTARELEQVVPKGVAMASSLLKEVQKLARAEGLAEGQVIAARSLCVDFVKQHRPGILSLVSPVIGVCADAGRLRDWALAAPRVSDAEFVRLVGAEAPSARSRPSGAHASRGRAPRPSRRAKAAPRR